MNIILEDTAIKLSLTCYVSEGRPTRLTQIGVKRPGWGVCSVSGAIHKVTVIQLIG